MELAIDHPPIQELVTPARMAEATPIDRLAVEGASLAGRGKRDTSRLSLVSHGGGGGGAGGGKGVV
eukprot:scaffold132490_cov55-Attheya_sp.AAC.4